MDIQVNVIPDFLNVGLQLIATFILFMFVKKFFWKTISNFLKEREDFIAEEIDMAVKQNEEAKVNYAKSAASINEAHEKATEIVGDSKKAATRVYDQIIADAKRDANYIKANAQEQIALEEQKFYSELKNQVADLAVNAAGKIIEKELDANKHSELIDSVISGAN